VKVIIVVIEILAAVWTDQLLHHHISRYIDKVIHLILSCNTFCSKRDADRYTFSCKLCFEKRALSTTCVRMQQAGAWLQLTWSAPQTINKLIIYGRPNPLDKIQNAKIILGNGYTATIGEIPIGGAAKEVYFSTATVTWVKFEVLESNAWNAGLAEEAECDGYFIKHFSPEDLWQR